MMGSKAALKHKAATAGSFKKGDARINRNGAKSRDQVELTVAMREAFTAYGSQDDRFKRVVAKVWDLAERGVPWAVEMVFDRIMGKVKEHVEVSGGMSIGFQYGDGK